MKHSIQPAVTLSVRVSPEIKDQLEDLASSTGRTKSFLAAEAIEHYLELQAWQIKAIKEAVKEADSKNAKFISHDEVVAWMKTWGTKKEKRIPSKWK